MVGDHQFLARGPLRDDVHRVGATVTADHQLGALPVQLRQAVRAQAIAVVDAVRDIGDHLGTRQDQATLE
jgi:hypothetical protein